MLPVFLVCLALFSFNISCIVCSYLSYFTGGKKNLDCGNHHGPEMKHNPPLLFNLQEDPSEHFPLDLTKPKYKSIISTVNKLLDEKYIDIKNDRRSKTDFGHDPSVVPCCNSKNKFCRCIPL